MKIGTVDVARIGLGTNQLRHTRENVAFIRQAVDAGVQMIDTAHLYAGGESEATIGEALSAVPERCIVATKGGHGGAGSGRPDVLRREIEESLTRLRSERLDLWYLHRVDPQTPIEESLGAIREFVDRGIIRHVGISHVDIGQIERARVAVPITAVQNQYNLSDRTYDAVVDYCATQGIVFVPYYPLHGAEGRVLEEIAARRGVTPRQIALAWLLRRSPAMLPIPGTLRLEHLKENLAARSIQLTDAEFEALR